MAESSGKQGTKEERAMIVPLPNTQVMCEQHPDEPVVHFCKPCMAYICPECMETEHLPHKMEVMLAKSHIRKVMNDMPEHLKALQSRSQSKTAAAAQLRIYLSEQERALTTGLQARQDWEDDVIAQLDKERRALVELIERVFKEKEAAVKEAKETDLQQFRDEMEKRITSLSEIVEAMEASTRDIEKTTDRCQRLPQSVLVRDAKDLFPVVLREVHTIETPTPQAPPSPPDLPDARPFSDLGIKLFKNKTKDAETISLMEDVDYLSTVRSKVKEVDLKKDPSGPKASIRSSYLKELQGFRDGKTTSIPGPLQTLDAHEVCRDTSVTTLPLKTCQQLAQLLGGHVVVKKQKTFVGVTSDVLVRLDGDITHVIADVFNHGTIYMFRGKWWFPCHMPLQKALGSAVGWTPARVQQGGQGEGKWGKEPDIGATTGLAWRSSAPNRWLDIWQ